MKGFKNDIFQAYLRLNREGILFFLHLMLISGSLSAIELSEACLNPTNCQVNGRINEVTNSGNFSGSITANGATISSIYNYGTISGTINLQNSKITHFYNYGIVNGKTTMNASSSVANFYNYGYLSGVQAQHNGTPNTISVSNYGVIGATRHDNGTTSHFQSSHIVIVAYAMVINKDSSGFNNFNGTSGDLNSHILFSNLYSGDINSSAKISFKDDNSKIILDFGSSFELDKEYLLGKLIVGVGSGAGTAPNVDFSRLATRSSLYTLTPSADGKSFVVGIDTKNSEVGTLTKSNTRTMNSLSITSNAIIFPRKYKDTTRSTSNVRTLRQRMSNLSSENEIIALNELQSNERFFYKDLVDSSETKDTQMILADAREVRMQQRYGFQYRTASSVGSTATRNTNANQKSDYYFVLAPYVNYNSYFESGKYNLHGLEYGGIVAISGRLGEINTLGAHFGFSYGSLGDKGGMSFDFGTQTYNADSSDKSFKITNMTFMGGLHYKLDLIYDLYIKMRGDFFYFMNQMQSSTLQKRKINNMGFGAGVGFGKDFDFGSGGVLGFELGFDYKGLLTSAISMANGGNANVGEYYNKHLYNLIYADLGLRYDKYFGVSGGLVGLNLGIGARGDVAVNRLAKSQILINNTKSVDMSIDNDKFLSYANAGISYVVVARSFDMEFGLAYYGSFGDRSMSNGGGFEWRTAW